jgi:hypothetical protein
LTVVRKRDHEYVPNKVTDEASSSGDEAIKPTVDSQSLDSGDNSGGDTGNLKSNR